MNNELLEALTILEQEKNISKETLLEAIENSLLTACKNHFGKADNIKVNIDPETCEFHVPSRCEKNSLTTGLCVSADSVIGVINSFPAGVITTCTSAPCFMNSRIIRHDL